MGDGEEFAGASGLRRAVELILVVLSLSHSIRVFAGKWQLIRNKLEELHRGLVAAENCDSGEKLRNLLEVVLEHERYVKVVVDVGDVVHLLVGFLGSHEAEIQKESAKVVSVVAGFDSYKGVLIGAGVIAPLVKVLDCGSDSGKVAAARCLVKLTENSNNASFGTSAATAPSSSTSFVESRPPDPAFNYAIANPNGSPLVRFVRAIESSIERVLMPDHPNYYSAHLWWSKMVTFSNLGKYQIGDLFIVTSKTK